nr:MAG TPA: hypothetical protein [Caudoviricetes sp.]
MRSGGETAILPLVCWYCPPVPRRGGARKRRLPPPSPGV